MATGSVKEYFTDVSGGLVEIVGEVVGPLRMQETMEWYANGNGHANGNGVNGHVGKASKKANKKDKKKGKKGKKAK